MPVETPVQPSGPSPPASSVAPLRRGLIRRRATLIGVGALLAGLGVASYVAFGFGSVDEGGTVEGFSGDTFKINYPARWQPLSKDELGELPGNPRAVLRSEDGRGLVVVRREKRAPRNFGKLTGELTRVLGKRVPDFQKGSSRIVRIRAGRAFMYSYIRKRRGTVHTVVIAPAGGRSYSINTVSPGGADRIAREIAGILLSFDA